MSQRREKRIRKLEKRVADLECKVFYNTATSNLDFASCEPVDAHYAPIPSGHKPGFFRRLWRKIFG